MEKRKTPKKPLVLIEWEDASNNNYYWDDEEKEKPLCKCHTVGFVMHRSQKKIVLATEGFDDGVYRNLHTIPKRMIVKIHPLKRA